MSKIKILIIFLFVSFLIPFISTESASASPLSGNNEGYFTWSHLTSGNNVLTDNVTDGSTDSVPICVDTKWEFIAYIKALHYGWGSVYLDCPSHLGYGSKNYGISPNIHDQTGADFIIQTMRGSNGNYDRARPDDSDVSDWENVVNSYPGSISWYVPKSDVVTSSSFRNSAYNAGSNDAFLYSGSGTVSPNGMIVFSYNGRIDYLLKRNCGNPMGDIPGISLSWSVSPSVSVNRATAYPGDIITWTHNVYNNGPGQSHYYRSDYDSRGYVNNQRWDVFTNSGVTESFNTSYAVAQNDVGTSICRNTRVYWQAWNNPNWFYSGYSCTSIPYNYVLNPSVTNNSSGVVESGASYTVNSSVGKTGRTYSRASQWQLSKFVMPAGASIYSGAMTSANNLCNSINGESECNVVRNSDSTVFTANTNTLSAFTELMGDYDAGSRVCFTLSVKSYTDSDSNWRHSSPVCMIVGKKPKVQILGGDLLTSGTVNTSTTIKSGKTFGSWTEYGIFADGRVTGMASGSAFSGGLLGANLCGYSTLTFHNNLCGSSNVVGNYSSTKTIPDVGASFPITSSTPTISSNANLTDLNTGTYKVSGNINIAGGDIAVGKWIVINAPTSTITINGNINYSNGTLNSINDIPQVVIIANKINIIDSVTNIDAWLIAKNIKNSTGAITSTGDINTCSSVAGAPLATTARLTVDMCDKRLVINGPVIANKLYLRRTAGSGVDAESGVSAETINLRPEAYLWANSRANDSSKVQTVYTSELPPRL